MNVFIEPVGRRADISLCSEELDGLVGPPEPTDITNFRLWSFSLWQ